MAKRSVTVGDVTIKETTFGKLVVSYPCPDCGSYLRSPAEEIGLESVCPECDEAFKTPGEEVFEAYEVMLSNSRRIENLTVTNKGTDPVKKESNGNELTTGELIVETIGCVLWLVAVIGIVILVIWIRGSQKSKQILDQYETKQEVKKVQPPKQEVKKVQPPKPKNDEYQENIDQESARKSLERIVLEIRNSPAFTKEVENSSDMQLNTGENNSIKYAFWGIWTYKNYKPTKTLLSDAIECTNRYYRFLYNIESSKWEFKEIEESYLISKDMSESSLKTAKFPSSLGMNWRKDFIRHQSIESGLLNRNQQITLKRAIESQ